MGCIEEAADDAPQGTIADNLDQSGAVTLHQVSAFDVVARFGSQTLAADELGVQPATVAAHIAALQGALSLDLFERAGGKLQLTGVVRTLWPHPREVMAASEDAAVAIDELTGRTVRGLRLVAGKSPPCANSRLA